MLLATDVGPGTARARTLCAAREVSRFSKAGARHRSCARGAEPGPTPDARRQHVNATRQTPTATTAQRTRTSHALGSFGAGAGALAGAAQLSARRAVPTAGRALRFHRGLL